MKRRTFLKTVGGAASVVALGTPRLLAAAEAKDSVAELPRRPLGRTGVRLSVVGFPGLALIHYDQAECTSALHRAFDMGVNYYDVAPAYGNGQCETKMGIGLQGLDRSRYFLACKTKKRDAEGALQELENSLQKLKTDHFDLYQLHHLVKPEEVKQALGPGGALEAILKAREQGKLKWIGFSAHTTKAALEALKGYAFDTVMFPINFVEFYTRDFGKEVLALARERGAAMLAIKPLSWGAWPPDMKRTRQWWYRCVEEPGDVELAVRFALSQPGVVACVPPSFVDLLERTVAAARKFRPLDDAATETLKKMAQNCGSIFLREEKLVAHNLPQGEPTYPGCPHAFA